MADEFGHRLRGPVGIYRAAKWSMKGLKAAWLHESSFRLEVVLTILLVPVAVYIGESAIETAVMIGSLLLVLSAELLNSAIEAVIARYGDEFNALTGRAKDMGSAAVFVLMINVAVVWGLILSEHYGVMNKV